MYMALSVKTVMIDFRVERWTQGGGWHAGHGNALLVLAGQNSIYGLTYVNWPKNHFLYWAPQTHEKSKLNILCFTFLYLFNH